MSSISRLSAIIDSAYKNDDTQLMRDAFKDYQIANCYYPKMLRVFDAHTQTLRTIPVRCGTCYHCMETKINEWVTRMYAHAEDFKHVYFITLTYRSFANLDANSSRLIIKKLKDAIWHRDSFNYNHHYSYNPCLLVKKHYQDFFKRLRKFTGIKNITYVLSGEYGSDYGRPHFHIILFSPDPITRDQIVRAWSVALWRSFDGKFSYKTNQSKNGSAYYFPIGRVDFNDLVSNGSFNTTSLIRVDGRYLDVANCFAYVCKYVCKRDKVNFKRVVMAYNSLYRKEQFVDIFNNEVSYKIAYDYLLDRGYLKESIPNILNNLKQLVYEKTIFVIDELHIFSEGINQFERISVFGQDVDREKFPSIYYEFSEKFSPFCEFSRGIPIGSVYAKRNVQEFAQGVFTKPYLQVSSYVVPNYFRVKAQEFLYGLRRLHKTFKSSSFNLGGLVNLYRCFQEYLQDGTNPIGTIPDQVSDEDIKSYLQNDYYVYFDKYRKERILIHKGVAHYFVYNRSLKDFELIRSCPVSIFVQEWYDKLSSELERYNARLIISHQNDSIKEATFLKMLDCGLEFPDLRDTFIKKEENYRREQQNFYKSIHKSVE